MAFLFGSVVEAFQLPPPHFRVLDSSSARRLTKNLRGRPEFFFLPMTSSDEKDAKCDIYGCVDVSSNTIKKVASDNNAASLSSDLGSGKLLKRRARRLRRNLQSALEYVMPGHRDHEDHDAVESKTFVDHKSSRNMTDELFESLDEDKDGFLTVQELLASKFGFDDEDMKAIDIDRDGRISKKELQSAVQSATSSSQQRQDLISEEIDSVLGDLEPLERQEMRLEGFEPYILVSVLTAEGSFGMISEMNNVEWEDMTDVITNGDQPFWTAIGSLDWLSVAVLFSAAFSTITGIYATTVFSLSMLYGKTALGMGRDTEYYKFMDDTGLQRFRAFQAFSLALLSFCTSVLLLVALRAPPIFRSPLAISSVAILFLGMKEYEGIVEAARPIFMEDTGDE
ncbi:MAG: hypothetical protein SGILL_009422 [Bacillariaceae sp.]